MSRLSKSFQLFVFLDSHLTFVERTRFASTTPSSHPPTPPICELSTGLVILASRPCWVAWQCPRVSECCCCCCLWRYFQEERALLSQPLPDASLRPGSFALSVYGSEGRLRHPTSSPEVQTPLKSNSQNHIPRRWCAPPAFKT